MVSKFDDADDDDDCNDMATMFKGGLEPPQNCFQKTRRGGPSRS